ncbi:hypothetical protein HBA55_04730 [Pseudomaricurvus alkylphenolicus]|jgi:hypothetical protein|nr:hypothetical protein [Pseudomaricurvus alkylphenolicus]
MKTKDGGNTPQMAALLSAPVLMGLFVIGYIVLAGFLPPPAPSLTAEQIAELYRGRSLQINVGMFFLMTSMSMVALWGAVIAARLRVVEQGVPILTYAQLINCAVATVVIAVCGLFWAAAAFRAHDLDPEILRMLNDLGWFFFLAPWPPFTFWLGAMAWAILKDRRPTPDFPRWTAFLCLWAAVLFIPAGFILIFKTGPFAWNGLLAFYIPVGIFFLWISVMTYYGVIAIKRESQSAEDGTPGVEPSPA